MTTQGIKAILMEKGISHLYHSNSVATACTFLENGGLLSRGMVEELGLYQTPQETDESDKDLDIFYDIFFDSVDVHQCVRNLNYYGPVLFVYSVNALDHIQANDIRITKDNPIRWDSHMRDFDKYFLSMEEICYYYKCGDITQHITLRHQHHPLSLEYLEKIILDNPEVQNTSYFEKALHRLSELLEQHAPWVSLEIRRCPSSCNCRNKYREVKEGYIYHRFKVR